MRRSIMLIPILLTLNLSIVGQENAKDPKQPRSLPSPVVGSNTIVFEQTDVNGPIKTGNEYWRRGDFANAIKHFKKATQEQPKSYAAQYNLGAAYLTSRKYQLAINPLQQAISLKPDSAQLWQYLGLTYFNLRDFKNAVQCFEKGVAISPNSAVQQNNAGYAYMNLGVFAKAETSFMTALKLRPNMNPAIMGLCITYGSSKKTNQTLDMCGRASALDPGATAPKYFLGIASCDLGHYEDALGFFNQGLKLAPGDTTMQVAYGFAQFKLNRLEDALKTYSRVARIKPSGQIYNGIGMVYFEMKKYEKSVQAFEQALTIEPDSTQAHFNLGLVCLARGDRDCSLTHYNYLKIQDSDLAATLFAKLFEDKVLNVTVKNN